MKFLIDMPVTPEAVAHLQAAGHDSVHASTIGLSSAADSQVLEVARTQGRIVVTADLDFPQLLAVQNVDAPGIILFRGGSYSDKEMLKLLDRVLAEPKSLELQYSITVINRDRIRRRRLPIKE